MVIMKHILFFFIITLILASCSGKKSQIAEKKDDGSALYTWQSADAGMKTAVANAQSTLDTFINALQGNKPALGNFALKIRFPGMGGAEDIWATNINITPSGFSGVINNKPQKTIKVKEGNPIKFTRQNITDWMYTENGKLRGGFTIRLIRDRMTVKERAKFDTAFVFKVE
jgi:uncharacterized protein YegJ (DUF2314 family)